MASHYQLSSYASAVHAQLAKADAADFARRLWAQDSTLWKPDDADHQSEIKIRLGWLAVAEEMRAELAALEALRIEVMAAGYSHVVLGAMGGSSLAADVFYATFGDRSDGLALLVLDSTHPDSVRAAHAWHDPAETLYIVASKSGGTTETLSFFRYFYDQVKQTKGAAAGENFIAITDPGSKLQAFATERGFRRTYLNPSTIGGRFSALSLFGLVPAALIGMDVARLLDGADAMARASGPDKKAANNAGVRLGVTLGTLAQAGRDKLTFVVSDALATFGYWTEQLIAESTGKEGVGIVPVEGETVQDGAEYGDDRVFVYLRLDDKYDAMMAALAGDGHPVIRFDLDDAYDMGGEMLRWEIATSAAGWVLGINPFDQPNVQSAKDFTKMLLADDKWDEAAPQIVAGDDTAAEKTRALLSVLQAGDYLALMAYTPMTPDIDAVLQQLRYWVRDRYAVATTKGYGPRFLHSTGQLHKGGANNGVFLQFVTDYEHSVPIAETDGDFNRLIDAQALGDFQALQAVGRRVLRVTLGNNYLAALKAYVAAVVGA